MKLLILTTVMAPYRVELFECLGKEMDLTVIFEQNTDSSREEEWYVRDGFSFSAVKLKKWDKSLSYVKLEILKWIKRVRPEYVIVYEYSTITAMLLMSCCQIMNIPYGINCDGGFVTHHKLKDKVKKWYIKRAALCIAGGEFAEKYFLAYGAEKDTILQINFSSLHNSDILTEPLTQNEKSVIKNEIGISEEKIIVSVGQFIHRKGFDILLKASSKLDNSVGIYIIGGEAKPEYLKLIKRNKIQQIHFLGFMEKKKLKEYYKCADIFVLPTREDVWGLVINEAMACGAPVITTDRCVAGVELIENELNGYVIPVEDADMLAEKANRLLNDECLRKTMAENNLRKIRNYTIEHTMDVIRGCLG